MATRTRSQLQSDASTYIPDNTTGEVSPEDVRQRITDIGDSAAWLDEINGICCGRLTLESGVPVSGSDQTAKTTLYFTPYMGNRIMLYTGSVWVMRSFTERSISLSGLTASIPYDVFAYDSSGTVTLELTAWTSLTARATAIVLQDGVRVKSGATTRRYLGTILITSTTGQCEDSLLRRFVWNNHNRVLRPLERKIDTDSWNYTTATVRQANADNANQVSFVRGFAEDGVEATSLMHVLNSTGGTSCAIVSGIGLDSTTAFTGLFDSPTLVAGHRHTARGSYRGIPDQGWHRLTLLEYSAAIGTTTWSGDAGFPTFIQSGIQATVMA